MTAMKLRGIDLAHVSVCALGLPPERACAHACTGGPYLSRVLRSMPITASDAVIDLGCGKGGALLTLAHFSFRRVDGVELSPNLVQIARSNLTRMGVKNVRVINGDAAEFRDLDIYTYVYMFNPFPDIVMQCVARNLVDSLARRPRQLVIIYKNPICHDTLLGCGFRKINEFRYDEWPFFVYHAAGDNPGRLL
jgi:SAM-dependent methyltransferase